MKKHPSWHFIFPVIFLGLSGLILAEGATPGKDSSRQSTWVASLFDMGPKKATIVPVSSLSLTGSDTMFVGESQTVEATLLPEDASDKRITYSLSGDSASLSGTRLTAKKEGQVVLTARSTGDETIHQSLTIAITRKVLSSLTTTLDSKTSLIKGMTTRLLVKGNTPDFSLNDVDFLSSDDSVAAIDSLGYVTTTGTGTVDLYVRSKADSAVRSSPITLSVIDSPFTPMTDFSFDLPDTVYVGQKIAIDPVLNPGCSDTRFRIEADTAKVTVKNNTITPKKAGKSHLKLIPIGAPELTKEITLVSKAVRAKAIKVSFASIQYGKSQKLSYSLISAVDGLPVTAKGVTFASDNASVCDIDSSGYLLPKARGKAEITVQWKADPSVQGKADITVTSMDVKKFKTLNVLVRKLIGHFSVFLVTAVFGILTMVFFTFDGKAKWISSGVTLGWGLLLAILSEVFQIFAVNRGPSYRDSLIDFSGYVLGAVVTFVIVFLVLRKRQKTNQNPDNVKMSENQE